MIKDRELMISVIGSGECGPETMDTARRVGELLARAGVVVVCGGKGGVMEGVCRGARGAGGRTVGILPGLDAGDANEYVDLPLVTGLGQMRNFLVVANGHSVLAVEGGWGTMSELAMAKKLGRKVVALGRYADQSDVYAAESPEKAVDKAVALAKAYLEDLQPEH